VIISIKDDSENLSKILPLILNQNYPKYEVILVNDNSSDDSEVIMKLFATQNPRLKVRSLIASNFIHGQSVVLGVGIRAAQYSRLVILDASCRPSENWLKALSAAFDTDIVTGYVRYNSMNSTVRVAKYYEFLFGLGYALNGKPYTASGENDSFRKEMFYEKGFNPQLRKLEKVEQAFFNSIMTDKNTSAALSPDAIVDSEKTLTFDKWSREASGNLYTRRLFRKNTRWIPLPETISRTFFYLSFIAATIMTIGMPSILIPVLGICLLRLITRILILIYTQKTLGETKLFWRSFLWDYYSLIIYLYIVLKIGYRRKIRNQ
jgi:glycosyltransferase involved in cell wall biosynthesis